MKKHSMRAEDYMLIEKYLGAVDREEEETQQEELAGETVSFNEQWFIVSEEELAGMQLEATYFVTDGCIEGDWKVVFEIPQK